MQDAAAKRRAQIEMERCRANAGSAMAVRVSVKGHDQRLSGCNNGKENELFVAPVNPGETPNPM